MHYAAVILLLFVIVVTSTNIKQFKKVMITMMVS